MDTHDRLEIGHLHLGEAFIAQDAGIVDEDMNAAPGVLGLRDHFHHLVIFGDIAAVRHGGAARRLDFLDDFERCVRMAGAVARAAEIVDHDLRTALCQFDRIGAAQAPARPRHDRHLAFERNRHELVSRENLPGALSERSRARKER